MNKPHGLQALEQPLASLPDTLRRLILERIQNLTHYEPVIGIMGKSGAGKSSLCNELFRGEVSPVSDVNACTRDVLRFRLRSGRHSLVIVDLPGVGKTGNGTMNTAPCTGVYCLNWIWCCGSLRLMTGRCRWTSSSGAA